MKTAELVTFLHNQKRQFYRLQLDKNVAHVLQGKLKRQLFALFAHDLFPKFECTPTAVSTLSQNFTVFFLENFLPISKLALIAKHLAVNQCFYFSNWMLNYIGVLMYFWAIFKSVS